MSIIFENLISRQLSNYFDNILLKIQYGLRKVCCLQYSILLMIDKWKKVVDSNKFFGVILTD